MSPQKRTAAQAFHFPQKPPKETNKTSWWLNLDRTQLSAEAAKRFDRSLKHQPIPRSPCGMSV